MTIKLSELIENEHVIKKLRIRNHPKTGQTTVQFSDTNLCPKTGHASKTAKQSRLTEFGFWSIGTMTLSKTGQVRFSVTHCKGVLFRATDD